MSPLRSLFVRLVAAVAVVACIPTAAAQDTTGTGAIAGSVKEENGTPLPGVRLCAIGTPRCATSNDAGAFRVDDLRAGTYQLEIVSPTGSTITSGDIEVRAGLVSAVDVTLPVIASVVQSVTVTAPAFSVPQEFKNSAFLVQPREVLKSAGALQDVSRYVQTLPGVVTGTDDFRNDLIVRGGSPLENLYVVDNVEIPNTNTFANFASAGGTVSILDAELLQDITFLSGGYPAPYINRTSSVLQVTQREGNRERFEGRATVGFAGAGTILEGPLGAAGKGSWVVSARRSFLDLFTQDLGFGGVPVLYTVNAKAVYDLSPADRLWLVNITGIDRIRLGLTEDTTSDDEVFNFDIRYKGWRSALGVNWQRILGNRGVGLLGVTHSQARVESTVKDLVRGGVPPPDATVDEVIASSPTVYRDDSQEGETTIKYDLTLSFAAVDKVQIGGSLKAFRLRYDSASPYGDDSPYSIVPGVNAFELDSSFGAYQSGAYVQFSKKVARRLDLTVGGRFDNYQYLSESRFSPRAAVSVVLTPQLTWRTSVGSYYQQPFFQFLGAFPENRDLVPFRADHYVTGVAWQPKETLRLSVEGYRKNYKDYPVATQFPTLSLANVGDTFNVREVLFPLTSAGRGHAEGVEFFVEKRLTDKFYGQGNVAFSRTRHAGLDAVMRPGSFDYPVVFNLVGGYRASRAWEFSTRATWLSGRPYTPYDVDESTAQRRGIYDLADVNGERLPDYVRWDVRVDRTFALGDQPFVVFLGVQNLLNRRNVGSYQWNRRTNAEELGEQQGLFPILGLTYRF